MKRRRSSGKFILAVSLLIVLGILTVAYATLSTVLQIKGSGTIEADTNFVKFVNPSSSSDSSSSDSSSSVSEYSVSYSENDTVANISITKKFTSENDYVYIDNIKIKNYKSDMNAKLNEVTLELNQEKLTPISYSGGLTFKNDYIEITYYGPYNNPEESAEDYILAAETQRDISLTITCLKVPTASDYDFNFSLSMDWGEYADSSDSSSGGNLSSDSSSM